jgi:NAD(P)-dependent dehydrogenase (short-subunit alcohol dehydrogenase family)
MSRPIPAQLKGAGVLITGASSGIGKACAIYLAEQGFTVLATVRREEAADALRTVNHPNLIPVYPLDLTKPDHISGVAATVEETLRQRGKDGLYAILNGAGGGGIEPVELMNIDGFRRELETRLVGPVELLQALLPSIRRAHGRILWIATPALMAIPYIANIHACDYAMTCLADTLHYELSRWHLPNILICCGGINTPSVDRTAEELEKALQTWPEEKLALYGQALRQNQQRLARFDQGRTDPTEVAKVAFEALTAKRPRRRYHIGSGAGGAQFIRFMPQRVIDAVFSGMA